MSKVFEKRDYQERIHEKATTYLNTPLDGIAHTVLIESPTGSGKTVMALRLAKWLEEVKGHKIGWIAHRRELLNQAVETNDMFFKCESFTPISMFTKNPEQYKDCSVVIVDECQHDASQSCSILHQIIKPKVIVGLTATPYRTDRAQLCFQKVLKDAGIRQLIREGHLSPFNQYVMERDWTPFNVASIFLERPEHWGKSVFYFLTIKDASECNDILVQNGIRSALITGNSPRDDILDAFEKDELQVICNVAVLTEGFDCPTLRSVFVRPSSKGPTVQMAGRAFRKHPSKDVVNVVQNKETDFPFTRHASARAQYIQDNGTWAAINLKDLESVFRSQLTRVSQAQVVIPEYLKKMMGKTANSNVIDIL